MKKLLLFSLLLWQFNCLKAQSYLPFPDSAAIWVNAKYVQGQFNQAVLDDVRNYCVNGSDTVINSTSYTKLNICNGAYHAAIRNTGGKVYIIPKDSTQEYILYDFTLNVGDNVTYYYEFGGMTPGNGSLYTSQINHIDTIMANGISRRRLFVDGNPSWIEGIGCAQGLLAEPWYNVSNVVFKLHCMSLNNQILYNEYYGVLNTIVTGACDLTLSVNSEDKIETFSIYPNPTTGLVIIKSYKTNVSYFEITNVLGEIIFKSQIVNDKTEIDLSQQTNGIYFLKVVDKEGSFGIEKIIKQ